MTITRVPLCTVRYCPAKSDPDWHYCVVCGSTAIEHHHVENRGMGGSKRDIPVIALCHDHHAKITLNEWSSGVLPDGRIVIWDLHGNTIWEKANDTLPQRDGPHDQASAVQEAEPVLLRSLQDGHRSLDAANGTGRDRGLSGEGLPQGSGFQQLTAWCQEGMRLVLSFYRLKGLEDGWRWQVGDWFNEGEAKLGDQAYAYIAPFRGVEALRQYRWVSAQVLHGNRHPDLSWSHHRAVSALPPQEQQEWLSKAAAESMTAPELNAALRPVQTSQTHSCPDCGHVHRVKP